MELCIQAVLADMKDSNANTNDIYAMAEAQWTRNSKFHSEIENLFQTQKKIFWKWKISLRNEKKICNSLISE